MPISTLNLPPHGESNWDTKLNAAFETLRVAHNVLEADVAALGSGGGAVTSVAGKTGVVTLVAADVAGVATSSAVAAKYTLPSGGVPLSDLAGPVQTSLGRADTAIQSINLANVPAGYRHTVTRVGGNWPTRASITNRSDIILVWKGILPAPTIDSTYALANQDEYIQVGT